MPEYSYVCDKCSLHMEVVCSIREYDKMQKNLHCEGCGSKSLSRDYHNDLSSLNTAVKKADSELKTIGDLAKRNSDKFSDDQKVHLNKKHNDYKEDGAERKPLPSGMSRIKKQPKTKWPT